MSKLIYFKRYLYVVDQLRSRPSDFQVLREYVIRKLENEDIDTTFEYSMRTFERDKKDIETLFGIFIQFDRKAKVYFIEDELEDTAVSRMIEAFSIHQALKEGNKISPSIFLESRKSLGTHLINGILHAIQNNVMLSFTHTKFWEMKISERTVKPIALKEAQHRWYLIAYDSKDGKIKNFCLDRISDLRILDTKFKPIAFNVEKVYQHAFGIETYEPEQKVVLQFSWQQGNYIKSFPLHASQKIISDTTDGLTVELYLHPTYDVVMELLKYGSEVKILEPSSLKETVKDRITAMMKIYQ